MNIIIVEDEAITALFLEDEILSLEHNVVAKFKNALNVLTFLNNNDNVDLIFMDIQISGSMDGIELAKIINQEYPEILLVFITSHKDTSTINAAKVVKPFGYLIKPVINSDIEAILMVVDSHIEKNKPIKISDHKIAFGDYSYDLEKQILLINENIVILSKNESICLYELVKSRNTSISVSQLIGSIWKDEKNRESSLRELIFRLRKKIINLPLTSIPNIGYVLEIK